MSAKYENAGLSRSEQTIQGTEYIQCPPIYADVSLKQQKAFKGRHEVYH